MKDTEKDIEKLERVQDKEKVSTAGKIWKVIKGILLTLEGTAAVVAGMLAALTYSIMIWMFKTWAHLTMDELVYQLRAPMQGTNNEMVLDGVAYCLPLVIVVFLSILTLAIVLRKSWGYHILFAAVLLLSGGVIWWTASYTWGRLDVETYTENEATISDFAGENYVDPTAVEMTFPEKKRNLIYIYLESVEATYSSLENGGGFTQDCIPELTALAQENEDFSGDSDRLNGGYSMPKTTWTVAAMFAHTSGLPLSIPIGDNAMSTQDEFLPQVTTLGDILKEQGYSQTLLIGSEAIFGGRRQLFGTHGDFTIHDFDYARDEGLIPGDYRVWWGYEDKKLFEFAKQEAVQLAGEGQPFNLTILTADTHFEDGYVCEDCGQEFGDNQYANVMACSSRRVSEFVRWVQQQDFYEDTTIVLVGDHPTMDSDFCQAVDSNYIRKVYTAYVHPAVQTENPTARRNYTTYDFFPTTLAALGVEIAGNRLGLGTNLFSTEATLTEKYGLETMENEMKKQSDLMDRLAEGIVAPPQVTAELAFSAYDEEKGSFLLTIRNFQNMSGKARTLDIRVYTKEDQSDLRSVEAVEQPDGSYQAEVFSEWFGDVPGPYVADVLLLTEDYNWHSLGRAEAYIR